MHLNARSCNEKDNPMCFFITLFLVISSEPLEVKWNHNYPSYEFLNKNGDQTVLT